MSIIDRRIAVTSDISSKNITDVWSGRPYLKATRRLVSLSCDRRGSKVFLDGAVMFIPNKVSIVCPPSRFIEAAPVYAVELVAIPSECALCTTWLTRNDLPVPGAPCIRRSGSAIECSKGQSIFCLCLDS